MKRKQKRQSKNTAIKRTQYQQASAIPISNRLSYDITKDKSPVVKRNTTDDVIYSMQYIGNEKFEYWVEYDDNRHPLSYRDSRGGSWGCKYNSLGNISDYWDYTGYSEVYRYYANDLVICTTSEGLKIKKRIKRIEGKFISRDLFINIKDDCI